MAPRKGKREAKEEVQVSLGPQVCVLDKMRDKPEPAMTPAQTLIIQGEGRRAGVRRCAHLRLL